MLSTATATLIILALVGTVGALPHTLRHGGGDPVEGATAVQIWYSNANVRPEACALRAYRDHLRTWEDAPLPVTLRAPAFPEERRTGDAVADVGILSDAISRDVREALEARRPPLMVGGNCVHLTGQISGLQAAYGAAARVGLAFIDAHGDINTPYTTISGSLGGMPVAVALGLAWPTWRRNALMQAPLPSENVFMLDGRDLDPGEVNTVLTANITIASAEGFPGVPDGSRAREHVVPLGDAVAEMVNNVDVIYMHIDGDVMDESLVPHHRLAGPGPNLAQMRAAIHAVMGTGKVGAASLVSIQCTTPSTDVDPRSGSSVIRDILDGWKEFGAPSLPVRSKEL